MRKKVLVVDDSSMWRNTIETALEKAGFTVDGAVDGIDALNKFFRFLPDVLVTDYVMPRMNGIQLTRLIRSYSSFDNVGILILTGASEFVNEFWAKKSGANLFLKKDEDLKKFLEKIMEFSGNKSFHGGWHRDIYKTHEEPFGELSDVLEEKLKIEAINRECLSFLRNLEDEERIIGQLTALVREFVNFKAILWLLISPVAGRIYSFPNVGNSSDELKKLLMGKLVKPLTPSKWHFKGVSSNVNRVKFMDAFAFPLKANEIEHGVVMIESAESRASLENFMDYTLESISLLAYTMNNFWEQRAASETDFLTSLFNRRVGIAKIKELLLLYERMEMPFTIALLDIDDFKLVNDSYGHSIGDKVLREFGNVIKASLRETDLACRYGGEEFLIVFQGTGIDEAKKVTERLKKNFSNVDWKNSLGQDLQVTFSAGLATVKKGIGLYDIIEKADRALYRAKSSGKNCIE